MFRWRLLFWTRHVIENTIFVMKSFDQWYLLIWSYHCKLKYLKKKKSLLKSYFNFKLRNRLYRYSQATYYYRKHPLSLTFYKLVVFILIKCIVLCNIVLIIRPLRNSFYLNNFCIASIPRNPKYTTTFYLTISYNNNKNVTIRIILNQMFVIITFLLHKVFKINVLDKFIIFMFGLHLDTNNYQKCIYLVKYFTPKRLLCLMMSDLKYL